jgi:acetyl-CoA acetyltransferase
VVSGALRRSGALADSVEEVVLGAANQAGEDNRDVARMAALLSGLPDTAAQSLGGLRIDEEIVNCDGGAIALGTHRAAPAPGC